MLMEERRRKFSQIVDLYSAPLNCSIEMHYISCYISQKSALFDFMEYLSVQDICVLFISHHVYAQFYKLQS